MLLKRVLFVLEEEMSLELTKRYTVFNEQLKEKNIITITDPSMTRYLFRTERCD